MKVINLTQLAKAIDMQPGEKIRVNGIKFKIVDNMETYKKIRKTNKFIKKIINENIQTNENFTNDICNDFMKVMY